MRYLLRNAIRDPRLNARRRSHPGNINRRPMIGGKPLPPQSTRPMSRADFTPALLDEIEQHQTWGNVQLLSVGRDGGEVDIPALRESLWPGSTPAVEAVEESAPEESKAVTPAVPAPSPPSEASPSPAKEEAPPAAASTSEEPPEEPGGIDLDEVLDPENPTEPEHEEIPYTKGDLVDLKAAELRKIIVKMGGSIGSLKKKDDLIDAVLVLQNEEGE